MNRLITISFFLAVLGFCLMPESTRGQLANPIFSSYNGEAELYGTETVTLAAGFNVPTTANVKIYVKEALINTNPFTNSKNYVHTVSYKEPFEVSLSNPSVTQASQRIEYSDGLGRPVQQINIKGSPAQNDVVTPLSYDAFGRQSIQYLPYTTNSEGNGFYKSNALSEQLNYYTTGVATGQSSNSYPYAKSVYESSPLSRLVESGEPGAGWQPLSGSIVGSGHTIKTELTMNNLVPLTDINNTRLVIKYEVSYSSSGIPTLIKNGVYPINQLYVTIGKGANWKAADGRVGIIEEYKDKDGRVLLKRAFNKVNGQIVILSTYNVYDDFGNLMYILPPGSSADNATIDMNILNNVCYQYKYDNRGRKIEQKLPGKGVENLVYNQLNQIVAVQDSMQRVRKDWHVIKYDVMGRVIITGVWNNGNVAITRQALQGLINNEVIFSEDIATSGHGYTNVAWPRNLNTFHLVNYYDTYNIPGFPVNYAYQNFSSNVRATKIVGLLTASKTWVLNDSNKSIWTVKYYDNDSRVLQVHSGDHLGGKDILNNVYDFTSQIVNSQRTHINSIGQQLVININYLYDHGGRLLAVKQKTGVDPEIELVRNVYNELGQLIDKKLHLKSGQTKYLQSIDYRYNQRGWLGSINDSNLAKITTMNDGDSDSDTDLFGMSFDYDQSTTAPQYNGNISAVRWKTSKPSSMAVAPPQLAYNYNYDFINQLTNATSSTNGLKDGNHSEHIAYNKDGNITNFGRWAYTNGTKQQIDSLVYTYNGNKHIRIDDISTANAKSLGFVNNVSQANEYNYDGNGNMVTDLNKGLNVSLNIFDLPSTITFNNGEKIEFLYDCNGRKLQRKYTKGTTILTTDYIDGIQYEQGQLAFVKTMEGRARKVGSSYTYEYDIIDNLGNVRVSFIADPSVNTQTIAKVIQQNSYYPYGMTMYGDAVNGLNLAFVSGEKSMYLYSGKELQEQGDLDWYDHGSRMYDPAIGKWNVADPSNQFASPYLAMGNNPVMFVDPDGEFIFSALIPGFGSLIDAALWGAVLGVGTNGVGNLVNDQPFFKGAGGAALWGGIGGAAAFGIGNLFGPTGSFLHEAGRAGAHALSGGIQSGLQGGDFWVGAASGGIGSAVSSGISGLGGNEFDQILGGGLSGGIGSSLSGGNFFSGMSTGLSVGLLNHAYQSGVASVREKIATTAEDYVNYESWAVKAEKSNFYEDTNKCNLFVYDVLTESGASPGLPNKPPGLKGSPPLAGQWANPDYKIPGWKVVPVPSRGVVAAEALAGGGARFTGHVGIGVGGNRTVSAGEFKIVRGDWGFRPNQKVVFRKWVGR